MSAHTPDRPACPCCERHHPSTLRNGKDCRDYEGCEWCGVVYLKDRIIGGRCRKCWDAHLSDD